MGEIKESTKTWRGRIELLTHLTILVALIFYIYETPERRKVKHYQAWQVINASQGKTGNCGRIDALQDLNKDGMSLFGVDLSLAYIKEVNLKNADLMYANFSGADLWHANLSEADLRMANLSGADLRYANLSGADLRYADLSEADLLHANLSGANLPKGNLSGANLMYANLSGANLIGAGLSNACLWFANLKNITDWKNIQDISLANIWRVENPPEGFIEWAEENGAVSIEDYDEWKKLIEEKTKEQKAKEE